MEFRPLQLHFAIPGPLTDQWTSLNPTPYCRAVGFSLSSISCSSAYGWGSTAGPMSNPLARVRTQAKLPHPLEKRALKRGTSRISEQECKPPNQSDFILGAMMNLRPATLNAKPHNCHTARPPTPEFWGASTVRKGFGGLSYPTYSLHCSSSWGYPLGPII